MPAGASQAACIIDCMKRQAKFMLSSNCYGSLLGRQPGAVTIGHSLIKTAWASATVPPCCTLPRIFGCHKLGVYTFEAVTEGHCPAVVAELAVSVCVCVWHRSAMHHPWMARDASLLFRGSNLTGMGLPQHAWYLPG